MDKTIGHEELSFCAQDNLSVSRRVKDVHSLRPSGSAPMYTPQTSSHSGTQGVFRKMFLTALWNIHQQGDKPFAVHMMELYALVKINEPPMSAWLEFTSGTFKRKENWQRVHIVL